MVEYRFARAGVLHESNVLFDADPNIYSVSFRTGRNVARWGGRSFAHPNISNAILSGLLWYPDRWGRASRAALGAFLVAATANNTQVIASMWHALSTTTT